MKNSKKYYVKKAKRNDETLEKIIMYLLIAWVLSNIY